MKSKRSKSLKISQKNTKIDERYKKQISHKKSRRFSVNICTQQQTLKSRQNITFFNQSRKVKIIESAKTHLLKNNKVYNTKSIQNKENNNNSVARGKVESNRQLIKKKLGLASDAIKIIDHDEHQFFNKQQIKNKYFEIVQNIFKKICQINKKHNIIQFDFLRLFGPQIYYFFGKLFHKIKFKKIQLILRQFILFGHQIFNQSSQQDIQNLFAVLKTPPILLIHNNQIVQKQNIKTIMRKQNIEHQKIIKSLTGHQHIKKKIQFIGKNMGNHELLMNNNCKDIKQKKFHRKQFHQYDKQKIREQQERIEKLNSKLTDHLSKYKYNLVDE